MKKENQISKGQKYKTKNMGKQLTEKITFEIHCVIAFLLRMFLITYANYHDTNFAVPYTDVDYKVFTDAARYVTKGDSPFLRHTYRYTPLLAIILTPNIYMHKDFGKVLFSVIDILVAKLIKKILKSQKYDNSVSNICALLWLYNPLTVVISTRGNADSIAVLLVLWTLYLLQNDQCITAGFVHGLSIHFRLYPLAFSLVMYLSLRGKNWIIPTVKQLRLTFSCALVLLDLTVLFYKLYGYEFLYESFIYHLMRKDIRHNFSAYFYMLYLTGNEEFNVIQKFLTFFPQLALLITLAVCYSSKEKLAFAFFTQAMVMVTYNPVVTSQYFFWFLSLLPLCLPDMKMSLVRTTVLTTCWILSQSLWLYSAYLLEFKGIASFHYIWIASLIFFIVNIKILMDVITSYKPLNKKSKIN